MGCSLGEGGGLSERLGHTLVDGHRPAPPAAAGVTLARGTWHPSPLDRPLPPSQQALHPASPRGIIAAGSGQTESTAPHPWASPAGEELFSPPEGIFQVFFKRTHFLCISESLYCEKEKKKTFLRINAGFLILSFFLLKLLYLLDFGFS